MANIRVDVNYTIKDGSEIVFRSPVDCTAITGLIVYYLGEDGNTTSKEFAFADAHGNNVGDIPHLFAENVVVKVILDVTSGMAFVQNADTNAYLERRFAEILAYVDENAGGVSSWNDLTDKPFGEEGSAEVLLEEQDFSFSDLGDGMYIGGRDNAFSLIAGETYLVRWDEKEYTCVAIDVTSSFNTETVAIGNGSPLGLPGDEPFAIMTQGASLALYVIDGSTLATHKVGISHVSVVVKTLDEKYLPMDAIDTRIEAKLAEMPDVSEVGM